MNTVFECFDGKVEKLSVEDINSIITENLLAGFFFPFCRTGLGLIFLTPPKEKKTFDQLREMLKKRNFPVKNRKYLERALDILLDIGLFSAKWEKIEQNNGTSKWARLFSNRNEIVKRLEPYQPFIKAFSLLSAIQLLHWFEILSEGPINNPDFFEKILEINAYLAHTGDIIDPDHWHITIKLHKSIYYSKLWQILYKISEGNIYDSNIKFYHERKKLAIYNLDEWIKEKVGNIQKEYKVSLKITQCKIRFLLEPESEPKEIEGKFDFPISKFLVVPIVNFDISGLEEDDEFVYSTKIDKIVSILTSELTKQFIKKFVEVGEKESLWKVENKFFNFNVDCRLLKFRLGKDNYTEFKKTFNDALRKYGELEEDLKMELTHLDKHWPLPSEVREKIENIEKDIAECVVKNIEKNEQKGEYFITVARKGDTLIRHLYELAKNDNISSTSKIQRKFKNLLESFKNGDESFYVLSDMEFLFKLKEGLTDLKKIFIFDDAIDEGAKVRNIIIQIKDYLKNNTQKLTIKVFSLISNKENFEKIQNMLTKITRDSQIKIQLNTCQKV